MIRSVPLSRPLALTLVLLVLALTLLLPGARAFFGGAAGYRAAILWGLPFVAAVAAALLSPPRLGFVFTGAPTAWRRVAPFCVAAFLIDYSFIGIGHLLGWITFTYGDQGLSGHPFRALVWGLPLCLACGLFGWEWTLRRTLFLSWCARLRRSRALLLSCLVGVALAAPVIVPRLEIPDGPFVLAGLLAAACREVSFSLLFASGAGLPAAGIFRGCLMYFDVFLLDDWYSARFPMANFNSSEPLFYLLRAATSLAALAVIAAGARYASRRSA